MIKSFFNQKEDRGKRKEKTKNLVGQLIEQQKLTKKVLKAITERIKE